MEILATGWARVYLGLHLPLDMAKEQISASVSRVFRNDVDGRSACNTGGALDTDIPCDSAADTLLVNILHDIPAVRRSAIQHYIVPD